jgi:hypothetical protein
MANQHLDQPQMMPLSSLLCFAEDFRPPLL